MTGISIDIKTGKKTTYEVEVQEPTQAELDQQALDAIIETRQKSIADGGYGTWQEQMEMIGEQGINAFQAHIATVKVNNPK